MLIQDYLVSADDEQPGQLRSILNSSKLFLPFTNNNRTRCLYTRIFDFYIFMKIYSLFCRKIWCCTSSAQNLDSICCFIDLLMFLLFFWQYYLKYFFYLLHNVIKTVIDEPSNVLQRLEHSKRHLQKTSNLHERYCVLPCAYMPS